MSAIKWYLDYIRRFEPLTKKEEAVVLAKAKAGDAKAYEQIINCNLRFVVSVAKKYQNQGIALEDLISEGNKGLVKSYYKFDTTRNVKFITYAVWWIRQNIMNCIHDNGQLIRLPWNKIVNISKLNKLADDLKKEHGRDIDLEELKGMVDKEEYEGLFNDYKYKYTVIDIDKPQTANNKTLNEVLPSDVTEREFEKQEFKDEVKAILSDLEPREREILKMYHGIGYTRGYTLKEIGIDIGLTRERIRQIKEAVFEKIRRKRKHNRI